MRNGRRVSAQLLEHMKKTDISALVRDALDPTQSVVVEACAGSGKTWLLVSRIVRLLIAGVAPSEILAITYTRKAAQEMQARLNDWLRLLASHRKKRCVNFCIF